MARATAATSTRRPPAIACGECLASFSPADVPEACPHCGAPLTASRRQIRAAELEERARLTPRREPSR